MVQLLRIRPLLCVAATLAAPPIHAVDWEVDVDARAVNSDGRNSFLEGGLGKLRFGDDQDGLRLGRLRATLALPVGETFALKLDASSYGNHDNNPIDVTEAYLEYKPYPHAGLRTRIRAGAFYPAMSVANIAPGWESPYSLSFSALDSWVAEEVRAIGLETRVDWLGTRSGRAFDVGATVGVFGWNDPAGIGIAEHGFAFHDYQTPLFGRVGVAGSPAVSRHELFREIDNRAGYYAGADLRYLDRAVLKVLHYDNRGNPAAFDAQTGAFTWQTRFNTAGIRVETPHGWVTMAAWLDGSTAIAPHSLWLEWDFNTHYELLARRLGRHQLSMRRDDFTVESHPAYDDGQTGHAWTFAYMFERDAHWRFSLEWMRVDSDVPGREEYLGELPFATETQLQLGVRYRIGSNVR